MAYDEGLAERIRTTLSTRTDVTERKMFGGLAFMVAGSMAVGIVDRDLMVRVGPDGHDAALAKPHTRAMDLTGRPMRGMVYVAAEGLRQETTLALWIDLAVQVAVSTPSKGKKAAKRSPKAARAG